MTGSTPKPDFGARLRQIREERGISLRQIATATKISVVALEALERDDISRLPGGIFSRAFVRSYAQEVGLDAEETVREFVTTFPDDSVTAGSPLVAQPLKEFEESAFESEQRLASTVLKLVLVSLPLGALLLYFSTRGGPSAPAPEPAPAVRSTPRSEPPPAPPEVAGPLPTTDPAGGAVAPRGSAALPTDPTAAAEPAAAPADGSVRLEVAPTGTCWVSLTVDGNLVAARVMQPGERIARRVVREAIVQVGDAGAFAFSINGRPGRPLGEAGQVRTLTVTPGNFEALLR